MGIGTSAGPHGGWRRRETAGGGGHRPGV